MKRNNYKLHTPFDISGSRIILKWNVLRVNVSIDAIAVQSNGYLRYITCDRCDRCQYCKDNDRNRRPRSEMDSNTLLKSLYTKDENS